ncbi:phage tail spike protein [Streptococcus suis]|uniref:phage tail spike protein n=1 Tax=Streptococcus suis TaxID=1307 RepID=UPI00137AB747
MISLKDKNVLLVNAFGDEIEQEGNGKYQLSFKYPTSDQRWKDIDLADLLLADDLHGEQEFRVFEIVKRNGYIFVYANQVVDDLNSYSISSISVDRVNGQTAMQALAGSIIRKHPFAFYSDIQDRHIFNQKNISVMDALANGKHSIVGQWGGDLVRDKYNVNLLKRGGRESEALFMYKKNLKSYTETNSIKGLFTRLNLSVKDLDIKTTVDSPLIDSYGGRIYELNIEVTDQDVTTLEQLQEYGRNYFAEKLIDVPNNSLTISVTDNQEYDVRIFDTVFVHHEIFDKDLRMKITSYRFSPMGRKLKSIGFGKIKTSLAQQVSNIATEVAEQSVSVAGQVFEEKLQKEIENADKVIDGKINKVRDEINDGLEQSKADAEAYADNIKQQIDGRLAESDRQYQQAQQAQDRQIADVLAKVSSTKEIAEQTVTDLMRVRNAFNQSIGQANTKALELERSIGTVRTDVMSQAQTILAHAQAQTALTNRVASVETTANSTKMTVAELSKTVNKATGDIASVTSRTKSVEDALSQTRTQYETLTQTINTQTGQIESINRKTADLQSGINGVTERFENLQVGGENLLLNAGFEDAKDRSETFAVGGVVYTNKLMPKWGSLYNSGISNPTTSYHAIYRESFNGKGPVIEFNESNGQRNWKGINAILRAEDFVAGNYMFSADVYATGPGTKIWFGFYYYNKRGSRSFHDGQTTVNITTTNSWHRVAGQIKLSDDIDTTKLMYLYIYAYNFESNSILYLTKPQLEYGTVATQFRLAQETLRSEIANYKRTAEESSAELSRQIQTVDGKAVDAKTYAQQTAEGFKTRIESLETYKDGESTRASQYFAASRDETARQVSALRTAVTDGYVAKAKYEEDARGVTQRFEEAQVGSVNLVINSKINETSNLYGFGIRRVRLEAGKKYWFGARARKNGGTADKKTRVYLYSSDWREERVLEFSNDEFTEKFTQFIPTRTQEYLVRSYWFPNGGDRSGHAEVDWYMVTEGTFKPSTWYPAPEDQQSYADTKIAEYKNTVDGQFTNLQSSINGKVSQADFQRVQTTSQLYERIIGSTEAGIKDKVARMVMADSLFLTEVKDKISGTATQVNQLSNSYAIKNLTSNGQILNQINLLANGTNRIDGRLTHITGQTLIDNGVIKNAMIGNLDAGKINTGTLNAARIATNSIDGSKLVFDQAFVNKMIANEALFKQLFAQSAFITSVQAVTMSASKIAGGILSALNGATEFNLQTGQISLKTDGASIQRIADGYPTHFLRFVNDATSYHSTTVLGASKTNTSPNDPTFAGMRIFNSKTKNSIVDLNAYSITFQQYPLATKGFYMDVANQELRPIDSAAQSKVSAKDIYIDSRSLATILDNIFDNFKNLNNNGNYTRNFYSTWR